MTTNAYISALAVGNEESIQFQEAVEIAETPADAGVDVGAVSTVSRIKPLTSNVWQDKQILLFVLERVLQVDQDVVARGGTRSAILMASTRNSDR